MTNVNDTSKQIALERTMKLLKPGSKGGGIEKHVGALMLLERSEGFEQAFLIVWPGPERSGSFEFGVIDKPTADAVLDGDVVMKKHAFSLWPKGETPSVDEINAKLADGGYERLLDGPTYYGLTDAMRKGMARRETFRAAMTALEARAQA